MTYISALPTPPSRADDTTTFSAKADALLGALPDFVTEANTLSDEVDAMRDDAEAKRAATSTLKDETTVIKDAAEDARDAAMSYRDTANTYRGQAETARDQAQTAAAAAGAAAGLPSLTGNAGMFLRVAESEGGVEFAPTGQTVEITSSTTWTKPQANVLFVELWAGGGGGANSTAYDSTAYASGGAGGEYSARLFDASDIPSSVTITIGAGGVGAASGSSTNGNDGGNTTFGSLLTAKGGVKGRQATTANIGTAADGTGIVITVDDTTLERVWTTAATSGRGGYATSQVVKYHAGQSTAAGGGGGGGCRPSNPGVGGTSRNGGNGGAGNATMDVKAEDGQFPSGGGGGSTYRGGGGNGGNGMCRITWW